MSNTLRYDSLLVRELALELDRRLAGASVHRIGLARATRTVTLALDDDVAFVWELHPARGAPRFLTNATLPERAVRLSRRTHITHVQAPADERVIEIGIRSSGAGRRLARVVIELMSNQWNALALDQDERILSALWARESGTRSLRPGARYTPVPASPRVGKQDALPVSEFGAPDSRDEILARVAYTSPINIDYITSPTDSAERHARYVDVVFGVCRPHVLIFDGAPQPYTHSLGAGAAVCASLLEAFERAVQQIDRVSGAEARLARLVRGARKKIEKLEAELAAARPAAAELRTRADLLLAQLAAVPRGATEVDLDDFAGGRIRVELDGTLTPAANAAAWYEQARKRERAAERMPALIAAAQAELTRLVELQERFEAGAATLDELPAPPATDAAAKRAAPSLPYRLYRTSGGLEVRVGRDRNQNDALTFHNSSPNDIWLHARDVGGAHVILRWQDAASNPPARDLAEAAALAAVHSKARTSRTVPVDWTRRKFVRKPRKAPPGAVLVDRAKTVFVEPDPALEERLRAG